MKKTMKLLALTLSLASFLSLAACAGSQTSDSAYRNEATVNAPETAAPGEESAKQGSETPTDDNKSNDGTLIAGGIYRDNPSLLIPGGVHHKQQNDPITL